MKDKNDPIVQDYGLECMYVYYTLHVRCTKCIYAGTCTCSK